MADLRFLAWAIRRFPAARTLVRPGLDDQADPAAPLAI